MTIQMQRATVRIDVKANKSMSKEYVRAFLNHGVTITHNNRKALVIDVKLLGGGSVVEALIEYRDFEALKINAA